MSTMPQKSESGHQNVPRSKFTLALDVATAILLGLTLILLTLILLSRSPEDNLPCQPHSTQTI